MILSRSFTMPLGWEEAISFGDFPDLSDGVMMATLQIRGQSARWNDA